MPILVAFARNGQLGNIQLVRDISKINSLCDLFELTDMDDLLELVSEFDIEKDKLDTLLSLICDLTEEDDHGLIAKIRQRHSRTIHGEKAEFKYSGALSNLLREKQRYKSTLRKAKNKYKKLLAKEDKRTLVELEQAIAEVGLQISSEQHLEFPDLQKINDLVAEQTGLIEARDEIEDWKSEIRKARNQIRAFRAIRKQMSRQEEPESRLVFRTRDETLEGPLYLTSKEEEEEGYEYHDVDFDEDWIELLEVFKFNETTMKAQIDATVQLIKEEDRATLKAFKSRIVAIKRYLKALRQERKMRFDRTDEKSDEFKAQEDEVKASKAAIKRTSARRAKKLDLNA